MESTVRLTAEEAAALATAAKNGDTDARNRLVERTMPLVVWHACQHDCRRVDRDDLIQAGALAALECVGAFDPARGSWSGWASTWIKGAMLDAIGRNRTIQIHAVQRRRAREYRATVERLRAESGFEPSDDEVRAALGVTQEMFENTREAALGPATRPLGGDAAAALVPAVEGRSEQECLDEAQAESAIKAAINAVLPPRDAEIFWSTVFEDKSTTQLAARFNWQHASVKRARERAVERLRDVLRFTSAA